MKKNLIGLTLLVSMSSFANSESVPAYLENDQKITEMMERVFEEKENHYSIILSQSVDLNFYDYIPGLGYLTISSALENSAEEDGINEIIDMYCSQATESDSKAHSIVTSFGDATGCAVQQMNDSISACIRYDFSCN